MEKISVIIPVYNLENHIKKSIMSVINQSYKNIEILAINDGSTDGSLKILEQLKVIDSRITIIDKSNGGLSDARNYGLNSATGDYITFLDGDDFIHPQMYQILIQTIKKYNLDIAFCLSKDVYDYEIFNKAQFENYLNTPIHVEKLTKKEVINRLPHQQEVRFEVWNKVYKREAIGDANFIVGQVYEDVHFNRCTLLKNENFAFVDCTFHFYLKDRPGNTSNRPFKEDRLLVYKEAERWFNELKDLKFIKERNKLQISYLIFLFGQFNLAKKRSAKQSIITRISNEFKKNFKLSNLINSYLPFYKKLFLLLARVNLDFANKLYNKI